MRVTLRRFGAICGLVPLRVTAQYLIAFRDALVADIDRRPQYQMFNLGLFLSAERTINIGDVVVLPRYDLIDLFS